MNERRQDMPIKAYLQQRHVQERIFQGIQEAHANATVTISQAAALFGFTENQLREWERRGLLRTERSRHEREGRDGAFAGHRRYPPQVLDKLAIMRELLSNGYSLSDIPPEVDQWWLELVGESSDVSPQRQPALQASRSGVPGTLPIDLRAEHTARQEFWRYFIAQTLRISLSLICHDLPNPLIGIVLPLECRRKADGINSSSDLPLVGRALVGWQDANRSFYASLVDTPTFEYPTDFRLEPLLFSEGEHAPADNIPGDVFVIVQRREPALVFTPELIEAVRRLLDLVYSRRKHWYPCFSCERYDWLYLAIDVERAASGTGDRMLNALLERALELGAKAGKAWSFCALLAPRDAGLPIQQQSLVICAQTRRSPYKIGKTVIAPSQTDSLSLKAFQSGQMLYFPQTLPDESMFRYLFSSTRSPDVNMQAQVGVDEPGDAPEQTTRSALALPVLGDYGIPTAVLYIASEKSDDFSKDDQRVLRVIGRMIEELLLTSQARHQKSVKQGDIISQPAQVDVTFKDFGSETDFLEEIAFLLNEIQEESNAGRRLEETLSIISLDIDKQSSIALTYGNRTARSLSQHVGERIKGVLRISDRYNQGKLFHISTDRYFLVLKMSLEEAQGLSVLLKSKLEGRYRVPYGNNMPGRPVLPENMQEIEEVTFHIGVGAYPFEKLNELLHRYPPEIAVRNAQLLIMSGIEEELALGAKEGGNCIITWDPQIWSHRLLK